MYSYPIPTIKDLESGQCFELVVEKDKTAHLEVEEQEELTQYIHKLQTDAEKFGYRVRRDVRFGLRSQVTHYRFDPPTIGKPVLKKEPLKDLNADDFHVL